MRRTTLALAGTATVVVAVIAWLGIRGYLDERRRIEEITDLRDRVRAARVSADSCANELAYAETLFRRFDEVVDSLRGEVRALESLDERGVPGERYDEYLERFEGYNDSVLVWEERAEALKADEGVCRGLIEGHNGLADSLRRRLLDEVEEGR